VFESSIKIKALRAFHVLYIGLVIGPFLVATSLLFLNPASMRRVTVNKDDCTSCNQCSDRSPDYFQMDEQDVAETHRGGQYLNEAPVEIDDENRINREIKDCPGECIHWLD